MWKRSDLKRSAKRALKNNYWQAVIVCLVLAVLAGAYPTVQMYNDVTADPEVFFRASSSNSNIVNSFITNASGTSATNMVYEFLNQHSGTQGILSGLFDNITRSGSFVFGILNALNQFIFGDTVVAGIIILAGSAILFLFWMFVGNLLRVGGCRFFMESRLYPGTKVNRLLYLYRIRRIWNPAKIMLLKTLYTVLWWLTIVGGPIMSYAYRMVPYIVAENPDIPAREAFRLSRRMMKGNKWRTFVLDLSFIGWLPLVPLTLGLIAYLFVDPYISSTDAELYLALRGQAEGADALLKDKYLAETCGEDGANGEGAQTYPVHLYHIPEAKETSWLSTDYLTHYTLLNVILIFFTFCMVGWVWEVFVDLVNKGVFVNRGTLHGPWLPIYGCGGVGVVLLFRKLGKRPWVLFLSVMAFCGVLEYATSWALEYFTGKAWWDYTGYFLNINGRICLEGLIVFGLGGCAGIYFLAPALNNLFNKIPPKLKRGLCAALVGLFALDLVFSAIQPNTDAATIPGEDIPAPPDADGASSTVGAASPAMGSRI